MRRLKEALEKGYIGDIQSVHVHTKSHFMDQVTHFIDYALWALGGIHAKTAAGHVHGRKKLADIQPSAAVVAKYDKDSDKTLDLAELQTAASARFDRLNKDADVTLDSQEVKGVIGETAFKAADTDHDGTLSKTEYLALVKKLFKQADTDHDGPLDAQELGSKSGHKLKLLID